METAITNSLRVGDKVLVVNIGNFGERFKKISSTFGLEVISLDYEWGEAADPVDIKEILDKEKDIKGVMAQFSETSTGALNDIMQMGRIIKDYPAIFIVDAISGLAASEFNTDAWNIDIVIGGSQKGLSAPTGLAFVSISENAWKAIETSNIPKFYFGLKAAKAALQKNQTPWTPGISIIVAMNKALDLLFDEGLENVFERHKVLARATQEAASALGLKLLVAEPDQRGFSVTAIKVPEGIDGKELTKIMRIRYGVTIAGGQGRMAGKIIRIGHLGYVGMFDIITAISALEMTLAGLGHKFDAGAGIIAAQKVFNKNNYLDK